LVVGCPEKFKTSQDRKDHMVRLHLYPADFRFDKPKTSRGYVWSSAVVTLGLRKAWEQLECIETEMQPNLAFLYVHFCQKGRKPGWGIKEGGKEGWPHLSLCSHWGCAPSAPAYHSG
jgi:hypothetical protein